MLRWFRKKKQDNQFVTMLAFDNVTYARMLAQLFENLESPTRAHVLVAYENLLPLLSALWSAAKRDGQEFTIEIFIPRIVEKLDASQGDEIGSRRWLWFVLASLLARLEKLSLNNAEIAEIGAKIWCDIAADAPFLKGLLPNNVVWKPEEKEWFDLSLSDEKLTEWTLNHAMPAIFGQRECVETFARSRELFYWPSKARVGIVP